MFGARLRELRKASGLSARAVAGRLGITRSALYTWEAEAARPTSENLAALARVYELSDAQSGALLTLLSEAPANG